MKNIIGVNTQADVLAIYKAAMLDKGLANRLSYLRGDKVIQGQGPQAVAHYAALWAFEALKEAKEAGTCEAITPEDILALAAMAISFAIVDAGVI